MRTLTLLVAIAAFAAADVTAQGHAAEGRRLVGGQTRRPLPVAGAVCR
ncbi:MAG: hypothetical protein U1E76_14185 [Planctomycetota bacterium]